MTALDPAILARVTAPIEAARGLPNAFYTDPQVFAAEQERVFARNWACIGFGKDVPAAGDLKPVTFLGRPLLLARGKDGHVRVFQNVCRHRGMILVNESKRGQALIRCPYHSWGYALDGSLRATPFVGGPNENAHPAIKRGELGLFEVRAEVWMDMVFVNLSGAAPDFSTYAKALTERWHEFAGQTLHHGGAESTLSLELTTNWKLAVENFCESYHLPWVHPGLNSYSRLEDHYNIIEPRSFSGQGSLVYNPQIGTAGERFASFANLSEKWSTGAEYLSFFPNVLLGAHKDHFYAIMLDPVALNRTVERLEIYYADPAMCGPDYAAMRQRHMEIWREVFVEDIAVVEGMQRGRSAPGFDGGKFSPVMDGPTHCFHDWVARQFLDAVG